MISNAHDLEQSALDLERLGKAIQSLAAVYNSLYDLEYEDAGEAIGMIDDAVQSISTTILRIKSARDEYRNTTPRLR